ncbi:MAG: DeoR family transcriptional regulator, partial [Lachnospiraceae bacterium]|nr:DeoR family transcriptional regulator [Lachnospiraceae bacterium]
MRNNRKAVEDRQAELLRMVTSEEEVPVEELAEKLGVSAMTIRRDLS